MTSTQKTKHTNKQCDFLTLTVSCEKMSCLIGSKKKKKRKENGEDENGNSNGSDNHQLMKMGNDSKTRYIQKQK